jgi:hypothetical protein
MTYDRPCIRPTDTETSSAGCCTPPQSLVEVRLGSLSFKVYPSGDCNGNIITP